MDTYNAYDIYNDIRTRTGGDIYLGVVGPVRTENPRLSGNSPIS